MAEGKNILKSRAALVSALIVLGLGALIVLVYAIGRTTKSTVPSQPATEHSNMVASAPAPLPEATDALRNLAPAAQASLAFETAFGRKGSATIKSGQNREATKFTPDKLIWAPFGPVLLSEGSVIDASHASAGQLATIYLKQAGTRFVTQKKFIPAVETGSFGSLGEWSVKLGLSSNPVVYVEGGGTWQGYTCSVATLLELAPNAPIKLAEIPIAYSNAGAITDNGKPTELKGRITNIVEGQSFDVAYAGSRRFVDHYVRRGAKYVLAGGHSQMEEC